MGRKLTGRRSGAIVVVWRWFQPDVSRLGDGGARTLAIKLQVDRTDAQGRSMPLRGSYTCTSRRFAALPLLWRSFSPVLNLSSVISGGPEISLPVCVFGFQVADAAGCSRL